MGGGAQPGTTGACHPIAHVGFEGAVIGVDTFGASAPGDIIMKEFGFTVENVVSTAKSVLG